MEKLVVSETDKGHRVDNDSPFGDPETWLPRQDSGCSGSGAIDALRGNPIMSSTLDPSSRRGHGKPRSIRSEYSQLPQATQASKWKLFSRDVLAQKFAGGNVPSTIPLLSSVIPEDDHVAVGHKGKRKISGASLLSGYAESSSPSSRRPSTTDRLSMDGARPGTEPTEVISEIDMDFSKGLPKTPSSLAEMRNRLTQELGRRRIECGDISQGKRFIPDEILWLLFTEETVTHLLKEILEEEQDPEPVAKTICGMPSSATDRSFVSYRKVFAILILIQRPDQILEFINQTVHDFLLPEERIAPWRRSKRFPSYNDGVFAIFDSQIWGDADISSFDDYQWQLCPPHFQMSTADENPKCLHYVFNTKDICLPFVNIKIADETGGFGVVYVTDIDPLQHSLPVHNKGKKGPHFAIKRLRFDKNLTQWERRERFNNESNILNRLTKQESSHLTKLLATFEITSTNGNNMEVTDFFLVFPCADMNLMTFWEETRRPKKISLCEGSKWMADQFVGLLDALYIFHNFSLFKTPSDMAKKNRGIHLDIKAQNVLHFIHWATVSSKLGVLQLADFGLSSYHTSLSLGKASLRPGPAWHLYAAPQVVLCWNLDQAIDTWALGCLFFEFLVWLMFGISGVQKFRQKCRPTGLDDVMSPGFYAFAKRLVPPVRGQRKGREEIDITIHTAVKTWAAKVHGAKLATQFVHDALDLVLDEMLVIENDVARRKNESDTPKSRAHELKTKFEDLIRGKSDAYFQEPVSCAGSTKGLEQVVQTGNTWKEIAQAAKKKVDRIQKRRKQPTQNMEVNDEDAWEDVDEILSDCGSEGGAVDG